MKKKRSSKHSQMKTDAKKQRPAPAKPAPISPPAQSPLSGEALELRVAGKMCEGFRATEARALLREACHGADDAAIEAAIVSPRVKKLVDPVTRAFALEHSVAILQTTFCKARIALVSQKPTPAEILALKIIIQVFLEKMMERIEGSMWEEAFSLLGFSDYEKSLIENLIQLERGLREPVAEAPPAAETRASAGKGE